MMMMMTTTMMMMMTDDDGRGGCHGNSNSILGNTFLLYMHIEET